MTRLTDGTQYIVFTDEEPRTGQVTVQRTVVVQPRGDSTGFIFANSVSFDTRGEPDDINDLQSNPSEYEFQFVRVQANYD